MDHRTLGRTDYSVSRLGFGAMRLPEVSIGEERYVDLDRAVETLHAAFRAGINYVDTGLLYGNGQAEIAVGRALRTWPERDGIVATAKATKFRMSRPGDLRRMLEHQLQRLERSWVHFYLFHGIGWDNYHELDRKTGWIADMFRARDEGLCRHVGFSFHDEPQRLKDLVDLGWAELVLCQYNYLDRRNEEAIAYAASKGVAVTVMGPVGGGRLSVLPKGVGELLQIDSPQAAELALHFVAANPHVDVVVSGMGSPEMVRQNVAALERPPLEVREVEALNELTERLAGLARLYCTGCGYCAPCPSGVEIARCFQLYNELTVYGLEAHARSAYAELVASGHDAARCQECGTCLDRCPQHIDIVAQLQQVQSAFS